MSQPNDPVSPGTSEAYLKLLKGEISSKQYVAAVKKTVRSSGAGRVAARRSAATAARRASAAG